jgi:hypothetical protein
MEQAPDEHLSAIHFQNFILRCPKEREKGRGDVRLSPVDYLPSTVLNSKAIFATLRSAVCKIPSNQFKQIKKKKKLRKDITNDFEFFNDLWGIQVILIGGTKAIQIKSSTKRKRRTYSVSNGKNSSARGFNWRNFANCSRSSHICSINSSSVGKKKLFDCLNI